MSEIDLGTMRAKIKTHDLFDEHDGDFVVELYALVGEVERLRARVKELEGDLCNWAKGEDGFWRTDCDNAFTFDGGTPSENEMKFCTFCGVKLTETVYNPEEGDNHEH